MKWHKANSFQCIQNEEINRLTTTTKGAIEHKNIKTSTETTPRIQKQKRKTIAPRFISPVTGMIVDQGNNVRLEGLIDGKCIKSNFPKSKNFLVINIFMLKWNQWTVKIQRFLT